MPSKIWRKLCFKHADGATRQPFESIDQSPHSKVVSSKGDETEVQEEAAG